MDYEKDSGLVMRDIERILGEMTEEDKSTKYRARVSNPTKNNYDLNSSYMSVQLLKVYYLEEEGEKKYYVEESALYAMGDRLIAYNPNSDTPIPIPSMEWLDKLIQEYETNNPSIKVEKAFTEFNMYKNFNSDLTNELINNYTDRIKRYIENAVIDNLTQDDIYRLIDSYNAELDFNYIKEQVATNIMNNKKNTL